MTEFEGHAQGAWAATRTESMARSFFEVRESQREVSADYIQSGEFTLQTRDDNDHTFHGIVFNVELSELQLLPSRLFSIAAGAFLTTSVTLSAGPY